MSKSNFSSRNNSYRRPLRFEHLEERVPLAVYTVNTAFDVHAADGKMSLREAILMANSTEEADTIQFSASLQGKKIVLRHGELKITEALTINGLGADQLTIDACGNDPTRSKDNGDGSRVFKIDDGNNGSNLNVTIRGLTMTGGDIDSHGGAILNRENLRIEESTITGNAAVGDKKFGGGIQSSIGTLTMVDCIVRDNSAASGGGIYNSHGDAFLTGCIIEGNVAKKVGGGGVVQGYGDMTVTDTIITKNRALTVNAAAGGIAVGLGDLTMVDSRVTDNISDGGAGGIYHTKGEVEITDSLISGNKAASLGGGILLSTTDATIRDTTISSNQAANGGGIVQMRGDLAIIDSLIAKNQAQQSGGMLHQNGDLLMFNATVSGNRSTVPGAGIFLRLRQGEKAEITHSTITKNRSDVASGTAIYVTADSTGTIALNHSIVAGNVGPTSTASDIAGKGFTTRYSIIGIRGTAQVTNSGASLIGTSASPVDPKLRTLRNNGGSTSTHAPLSASPARNAGDPNANPGSGGVPEFDQRGEGYSRVAEGRIDIGAFEYQ